MNRVWALLGAMSLAGSLQAAVTPNRTDFIDYCKSSNNTNCVYRIDASGNVTTSAAMTATGFTNNGNETVVGLLTVNKKMAITPTALTISSNTVITANGSYEVLTSSGGNLALSGVPTVKLTGAGDGSILVLAGGDDTTTFVFQDAGTLTGSGLHLGANSRTVGAHKTLTLIFSIALNAWSEVAYANNN